MSAQPHCIYRANRFALTNPLSPERARPAYVVFTVGKMKYVEVTSLRHMTDGTASLRGTGSVRYASTLDRERIQASEIDNRRCGVVDRRRDFFEDAQSRTGDA
jgi:hypothetical protein